VSFIHENTTTYVAFVGLDWADRSHQVCLRAADGTRDEQSKLAQDRPRCMRGRMRYARVFRRENCHRPGTDQRPLVYALSMHAHLELFPINPAMLAKYREAAKAASGTKNDPLDASLLCELLRVHRDWLRSLPTVPAAARELQMLLETRRGLVDQRTVFAAS